MVLHFIFFLAKSEVKVTQYFCLVAPGRITVLHHFKFKILMFRYLKSVVALYIFGLIYCAIFINLYYSLDLVLRKLV
jgi:hypothetical protein